MLYLVTDAVIGRSLDRYGEYCQGEVDLFAQVVRAGDVAVDVGAHIGAHTVPLAHAVTSRGAVVAFEPQRILFQCLCANVALNGLDNVRTRHAAVGRRPGRVRVPQIDYAAGGNFGGLGLTNRQGGEQVELTTLDSLGLTACNFVKIDVEGMESQVIDGAGALIGRFRPVLYVENNRQAESPELIRRLLDLDYALYWHFAWLYNRDNHFAEAENVFGDTMTANMLCLPKESPRLVSGLREVTGPDDFWRRD
jgi:FkbM family methyltransferase